MRFICILQLLLFPLLCQKKYARMIICQYQMDLVDIFLLAFSVVIGFVLLLMLIGFCVLWYKRWKYYMRHPLE